MTTITNIVCTLIVFATSVSPNTSPNAPQLLQQVRQQQPYSYKDFVPIGNFHHAKLQDHSNTHTARMLRKRHTPFLPGDHWKGMRPDFGPTQTDIEVMVNGTARMKCPITHVSDNRVSKISCSHLCA